MAHTSLSVTDVAALQSLLDSARAGRERAHEDASTTEREHYTDEDRWSLAHWHKRERAVSDDLLRQLAAHE
jgi:hypothetical protein